MDHPNGHPCPECGAPRHADNTPSCACTRRAADALRDARTAEAAAAEDFDPLRIRPYVELSSITPDGSPEATEPGPQAAGDGDAGSPGATMTFKAVRPDAGEPGGVRAPGAGGRGQAGRHRGDPYRGRGDRRERRARRRARRRRDAPPGSHARSRRLSKAR